MIRVSLGKSEVDLNINYDDLDLDDLRVGHEGEKVVYPKDGREDYGLWMATHTAHKQMKMTGSLNRLYVCPKCHNRGFTPTVVPYNGKYRVEHIECECMIQQHIEDAKANSGMPKEYQSMNSSNYQGDTDWQKQCKSKARLYCNQEDKTNTWFIMLGQSGCGKTTLCNIILNNLIEKGMQGKYIVWSNFISNLKRLTSGTEEDKREASYELQEMKDYDLLFLDECLKTYNDTDIKYFNEIINSRYTNKKKTILASERMMDEFKRIDSSVHGRMVEMTKNGNYILQIKKDESKNFRIKDYQENSL